jgi:hypothetical protein
VLLGCKKKAGESPDERKKARVETLACGELVDGVKRPVVTGGGFRSYLAEAAGA